jgi:hypothetical protein
MVTPWPDFFSGSLLVLVNTVKLREVRRIQIPESIIMGNLADCFVLAEEFLPVPPAIRIVVRQLEA